MRLAHGSLGRRHSGHRGCGRLARSWSQSTQTAWGRGHPWNRSDERDRLWPTWRWFVGRGSGSEKASKQTEQERCSPARWGRGGVEGCGDGCGPQLCTVHCAARASARSPHQYLWPGSQPASQTGRFWASEVILFRSSSEAAVGAVIPAMVMAAVCGARMRTGSFKVVTLLL